MVFEIGAGDALVFIIYCIVVIAVSKFVIRNLSIIYSSYGVYHYCKEEEFNDNCNRRQHRIEDFRDKIKMVFGSNVLVALVTTIVIVGFQFFSSSTTTITPNLSLSLSLNTILALSVLAIVFNTALRLSAFATPLRGSENLDPERARNVKSTIVGFGFSFWATLYFLLIIGGGIATLTGDPSFNIEGFEISFSETIVTAFITLIIAPLLGAIISECSLYLLEIPNGCKDCKECENDS